MSFQLERSSSTSLKSICQITFHYLFQSQPFCLQRFKRKTKINRNTILQLMHPIKLDKNKIIMFIQISKQINISYHNYSLETNCGYLTLLCLIRWFITNACEIFYTYLLLNIGTWYLYHGLTEVYKTCIVKNQICVFP